jgi:hypothetical protein
MSERARIALIAGATTFGARIVIGLLIMGLDRLTHEADMLLFVDLPTLGLYFLLARIGYPHDIVNAYDLRFFVIGAVVWLVVGWFVGWLASRFISRSHTRTSV